MSAVAVVAALAACTTTNAIRLPLVNNPEPERAKRCYRDCQGARLGGDDAYRECLGTCPNVEVTENDKCRSGEKPPTKVCVEEKKPDTKSTVLLVLGVLLALIVIGATQGDSSQKM